MKRKIVGVLALLASVLPVEVELAGLAKGAETGKRTGLPIFEIDPNWPKMEGHFGVNGNWIFGAIGGIAVDPTTDHIWAATRPWTLRADETYALLNPDIADCCVPAPPILEFDSEGNFIQGWGGWNPNIWVAEHGISVDHRGNVWLGNGGDNVLLKFTRTGRLLLQIGYSHTIADSTNPETMGVPTRGWVYPKTNEVFVSDGYVNRRVIVFDADTGKFKRLWGAYGKEPDDTAPWVRAFQGPPPQQFFAVHDITVSNDGLVYVADRDDNRVQVFQIDGTFAKEAFVERLVRAPSDTVIGLAFSADERQQFLYVAGADDHIRILDRNTLKVLGSFGRMGYYPGQMMRLHGIAVDSKGNLYTSEAGRDGRHIQKFVFKGLSSP
jgi:DNA-binding beta-propeller fold protein YncE